MYEIKNYQTANDNDMNHLITQIDNLNILIEQNFGDNIDASFFHAVYNVFVAYDNQKIIGCAFVCTEWDIVHNKTENFIPTYSHILVKNYLKNFDQMSLYPIISGLCRDQDEKYKGVGSMIIDSMCEYFENMHHDREYIYLVVGSGKHEITIDSSDKEKEEYVTMNHHLIDYYTKNKFEIMMDNYCINFFGNHCVFENVMRRKLSRSESDGSESDSSEHENTLFFTIKMIIMGSIAAVTVCGFHIFRTMLM